MPKVPKSTPGAAGQRASIHDDWIFSNNSNVHVSNNKAHFVSLTPFDSLINPDRNGSGGTKVLGIGDVKLDAKISATRKGSASHRPLVLHNVLYAPDTICNILGNPIFPVYNAEINFGAGDGRLTEKSTGKVMAMFEKNALGLIRLKLSGQGPPAKITGQRSEKYWIIASWPEEEQIKWKSASRDGVDQAASKSGATGYSDEEKRWMKEHYGNEFKFLQAHGLNIHKDEHREEGREILRAFMREGSPDGSYNEEDDDDADSFLDELESDPMSHVADYHFTETQLDWIKKRYGHSGNFMLSHGLKPFDDGDCREGVMIAKSFMKHDK